MRSLMVNLWFGRGQGSPNVCARVFLGKTWEWSIPKSAKLELSIPYAEISVVPGGLSEITDRCDQHDRMRPSWCRKGPPQPMVTNFPARQPCQRFVEFGFGQHVVFGHGMGPPFTSTLIDLVFSVEMMAVVCRNSRYQERITG